MLQQTSTWLLAGHRDNMVIYPMSHFWQSKLLFTPVAGYLWAFWGYTCPQICCAAVSWHHAQTSCLTTSNTSWSTATAQPQHFGLCKSVPRPDQTTQQTHFSTRNMSLLSLPFIKQLEQHGFALAGCSPSPWPTLSLEYSWISWM